MKAVLRFILLIFFCASLGVGIFLWRDREMVQNELLDREIAKLAPRLPFEIVSYRLSKKLDYFEMHLKHQGVPISIAGPLVLSWIKKEGMSIEYSPELIYGDSTPLRASLKAVISRKLEVVDGLKLEIAPQDFKIKSRGLALSQMRLSADYRSPSLALESTVASLAWTDPANGNRAVSVNQISFNLNAPQVPSLEGSALSLKASASEILWDKIYADLNLRAYPLSLKAETNNLVQLEIGEKIVQAKIELNGKDSPFDHQTTEFQTSKISVADTLPYLIKTFASTFSSLSSLADFELKKGTLQLKGLLDHDAQSGAVLRGLTTNLSDVSFRSLRYGISGQGFNVFAPYRSLEQKHKMNLSAAKLNYKHFEASLAKTDVAWTKESVLIPHFPLNIKNIPLHVTGLKAKLEPEFELSTELNLASVDIKPFVEGLCQSLKKFPPGSLQGNFKHLSISSSVIDTEGSLELSLFRGKVKLNELSVYDLNTEVPETDFDFEWSGIDMLSLGEWSKFGEIKGTLEGYAHEVVLQSSLPTHYHFLLQVVPLDRHSETAQVEFSPEAMKNVVRVFTGTSLEEHMPGIAGWLMFGWPSRVFGGYDVNYAGIKLTSEDGHIVVETLDRPGIFERERKHFVLYGPRFKMPLRNSSYPLLIDATAMSNFVHQLTVQLGSIKQKKEGNPENEESTMACDPPEI